jgi:hypothetical protein
MPRSVNENITELASFWAIRPFCLEGVLRSPTMQAYSKNMKQQTEVLDSRLQGNYFSGRGSKGRMVRIFSTNLSRSVFETVAASFFRSFSIFLRR